MIIRVVKDATLTVKAGQLVEVDEGQAVLAIRLGLAVKENAVETAVAEPVVETPEKKPTRKKK